jgi:hypothetical protein
MKQHIVAIITLSLSMVVWDANAETACEVNGGCGGSNSNALGQTQDNSNTVTMAPTMAMSNSGTNTVIGGDSYASSSISMAADGGISINGNCPTSSFGASVSMGGNEIDTRPSYYESRSKNAQLTLGINVPFGEGRTLCEENQRLGVKLNKLAVSKSQITGCIDMAKLGVRLESIVAIAPQMAICEKIWADAQKGYHGQIARQAVENYKKAVAQQTGVPAGPNQARQVNALFAK